MKTLSIGIVFCYTLSACKSKKMDTSSTDTAFNTDTEESINNPLFYLARNGVTVMCPNAEVGTQGTVNGITYTKVDRNELYHLIRSENYADVEHTCVSGIRSMEEMFSVGDYSFNGDISHWDVSSVYDMSEMFRMVSSFNGDISGWDVRSVDHEFDQGLEELVSGMEAMFEDATSFNQDLSSWCVSNISSVPENFDTGATNWTEPKPVWGSCP